jgi:hypothetical protein
MHATAGYTRTRPRGFALPSLRPTLEAAVVAAYYDFARRNPAWEASLFDAYFVRRHVLPLLDRALREDASIAPSDVAAAWAAHLSGDPQRRGVLAAAALPAATEFLRLVERAWVHLPGV